MSTKKQQNIVLSSHTMLNGKPLDFSFKNIQSIAGSLLNFRTKNY